MTATKVAKGSYAGLCGFALDTQCPNFVFVLLPKWGDVAVVHRDDIEDGYCGCREEQPPIVPADEEWHCHCLGAMQQPLVDKVEAMAEAVDAPVPAGYVPPGYVPPAYVPSQEAALISTGFAGCGNGNATIAATIAGTIVLGQVVPQGAEVPQDAKEEDAKEEVTEEEDAEVPQDAEDVKDAKDAKEEVTEEEDAEVPQDAEDIKDAKDAKEAKEEDAKEEDAKEEDAIGFGVARRIQVDVSCPG